MGFYKAWWCKAAYALLAVTCNLFPKELYHQRGGKKRVKDRTSKVVWFSKIPNLMTGVLLDSGLGHTWRWQITWTCPSHGQHHLPDNPSKERIFKKCIKNLLKFKSTTLKNYDPWSIHICQEPQNHGLEADCGCSEGLESAKRFPLQALVGVHGLSTPRSWRVGGGNWIHGPLQYYDQ